MSEEMRAGDHRRRQFVQRLVAGGTSAAMLPFAANAAPTAPSMFATLTDFGAVGDGVTDDTLAVQQAIDAAVAGTYQAIYVTKGVYKLTAPITIGRGISLIGEGCEPYRDLSLRLRGGGSWFYLAHGGKGFVIQPTAPAPIGSGLTDVSGFTMEMIGTYRDQPIPTGSTYTPASHDWDIYVSNSDVRLENLVLLNPTNGICIDNSLSTADPFSRATIRNIRGQPLRYGISVQDTRDACRISDIHWWCFWIENNAVWDYQQQNLIGIQLARCDTPFLTNIFMLFVHVGLKIVNTATGTTTNLALSNANFDGAYTGLIVDSAVYGLTAQFTNVVIQGIASSGVANNGIQIDGQTCTIDFSNLKVAAIDGSAVRVGGSTNNVGISGLVCYLYDGDAAGHPAIDATTGNTVVMSARTYIGGSNTAQWFGGAGSISCSLGSGTTSTTTDAAGYAAVTQNFGIAPRKAFIQASGTSAAMIAADMFNKTWFRTRHFGPTGAPLANTVVNFHWRAEY